MEPKTTAIVLIEYQNDFTTTGGTLHDAVKPVMESTKMLENTKQTNCCVESTMRSAYERGYDVITLTDCTATLSEEEQRFAVEKNFTMFSRPMTHDAFLEQLSGKELAASSGRGYTN
jgi:nicotinamidase-related amidase